MLTPKEARVILAAKRILEREGNYTKTNGYKNGAIAYVAGKADTCADLIFDYLNCAEHYAEDEAAKAATKEM